MQAETAKLLARLGERVRSIRTAKRLARRALAEQSGISERFIADVESGRGNISIAKLSEIAGVLGIPLSVLLANAPEAAQSSFIALLGLRGAGKSTVGRALASKLGLPFFELDRLVEVQAGMRLSEIFAIHGERYFRGLELETVERLFKEQRSGVIEVGGGIVDSPETFRLLKDHARTVWLKATPDEHWERVIAQGDLRPIQNRPHAKAELKRRLREREPLYSQADFTCSTSGRAVSSVVADIVQKL